MKKYLLYFILILAALNPVDIYGQWSPGYNYITFDPSDTISPYINWQEVISIDTVN